MRGPVPKPTHERRRRNVTNTTIVHLYTDSACEAPPLREGLHPLAVRWYQALADSAQTAFYQPSDWAQAQIIAEAIAEYAVRPRASLLTVILAGSTSLLVTEGDRRRLRIELKYVAQETGDGQSTAAPKVARKATNRRSRLLKAVGDG